MFSADRVYRYWLEREWDPRRPRFTFVLLNPSRAGEQVDDPTTRKLRHLSAANGAGAYTLVNLFAAVDTHQRWLHLTTAVGESAEENDGWIGLAVRQSVKTVIGWGTGSGAGPRAGDRQRAVGRRVQALWPVLAGHQLWCVGCNRGGSPRHPGRGVANRARFLPFVPASGYPDGP